MAISVKLLSVRLAANEMARSCRFVMLNLNTIALPLAAEVPPLVSPPRTARADAPDCVIDMLPVAFKNVPPEPLISVLVVPVAGTKKLLEPLVPSRYKVPVPVGHKQFWIQRP